MNSMDKINEARVKIFKRDPLLNFILQKIKINIVDCDKTAYTDGREISFCKPFLEKLNVSSVAFVLVHELLHIMLRHVSRIGKKNHKIYNYACDYVINDIAIRAGFDHSGLPNILLHRRYGFQNSAEQVYDALIKEADINLITLDDHSFWGNGEEGFSEEEINKMIKDGLLAGHNTTVDLRNFGFKDNDTKKINWVNLLSKYLNKNIYDYSYKRIDSRFKEVLIPKFLNSDEKLEDVWVLFDVSGSVDKKELAKYYSKLKSIFNTFKNVEFKVSFFSNIVTEPIKVKTLKQFINTLNNIKTTGGTSFRVIFDSVDEFYKKAPKLIIIFTDGMAKFPRNVKNENVIWMVTNNVKPRFGKVVRI